MGVGMSPWGVCSTPNRAPDCGVCPLKGLCPSVDGLWRELPFKSEKKPRRSEEHTVFLLRCGEETALRRRADSGLLAGLWEFPNVPGHLSAQEAIAQAERWGVRPRALELVLRRTHVFTHVEWDMQCCLLRCGATPDCFAWADRAAMERDYALPTAFRMFRDIE